VYPFRLSPLAIELAFLFARIAPIKHYEQEVAPRTKQ